MKRLFHVLLFLCALILLTWAEGHSQQKQFGIDDLKRMLADRDIAIEQQNDTIRVLNQQIADLKNKPCMDTTRSQ